MQRYISLIITFFTFRLKSVMEYRFNYVMQLVHGPAYIFMMYVVVAIAFRKAGSLAGWSPDEGMLLFFVHQSLYLGGVVVFLKGIRQFLWEGLRRGDLDIALTKPISSQFFLIFHVPDIEQVPLLFGMLGLLARQLVVMSELFTLLQFSLFLISYFFGILLHFASSSLLMSFGFYMTRGSQLIEMYDKISDFAQYPTPIFPASIQWFAFVVIPIAFFGYVPTALLLGKMDWSILLFEALLFFLVMHLSKVFWKESLKHYSSASS